MALRDSPGAGPESGGEAVRRDLVFERQRYDKDGVLRITLGVHICIACMDGEHYLCRSPACFCDDSVHPAQEVRQS